MLYIATEGPLGWAGRRHCLRNRLAFTTAFHTKFPEIVNAAVKIPVSWGYALMRHFHGRSSGIMVPTRSVLQMLEQRGFKNLRAWTHGVDTDLFPALDVPVLTGRQFHAGGSSADHDDRHRRLALHGIRFGLGPLECAQNLPPDPQRIVERCDDRGGQSVLADMDEAVVSRTARLIRAHLGDPDALDADGPAPAPSATTSVRSSA